MSTLPNDTETRLRTVVAKVLRVEPAELDETARFVEHYGLDSMASIEVLAQVEREFDLDIPEENLPRIVNLAGVRDVLAETLVPQGS
jgi:acyl carrier protein